METSTNLIAPLTFADGVIDQFIARKVCYCGSHLVKFPAPDRLWYAQCPEHGRMVKDMAVSRGKAAKIKTANYYAARELR